MKLSVVCWLHYEFYFAGACFPHRGPCYFYSIYFNIVSLFVTCYGKVFSCSVSLLLHNEVHQSQMWMKITPTLRENHAIALTNLHLYFYKCFEVVYFMLIVTTYVFSVGTLWPSDIVLLSSHKGRIVEPVSRSRSRSPRPRYEYFFLGGYDPDDMWGTSILGALFYMETTLGMVDFAAIAVNLYLWG